MTTNARPPAPMKRGKSAGAPATVASKESVEEIRGLCRRVAPYMVRQWREVCSFLGVADNILDDLVLEYQGRRKSELAFQGLYRWQETAGRGAHKDKILKALQHAGLKRAEDEYRAMDTSKRKVPYMGRPENAAAQSETPANKQAKQKAFADRLSRPKTSPSGDQQDPRKSTKKPKSAAVVASQTNPLTLQVPATKPTDRCELKLKVTVKGVQRRGQAEVEATRDDFRSTKDDYKHTCHTFVKLVLANRRFHFRELRRLLDFPGISIQRLTIIGFNINVFILCHTLGAFEILHQTYVTGRLSALFHRALVTQLYLDRLCAAQLELSVTHDEAMTSMFRNILVERSYLERADSIATKHPVDECDYFTCDTDDESDYGKAPNADKIKSFDLSALKEDLNRFIGDMKQRLDTYNENIKDLLMTLRIVGQGSSPEISCLDDVIECLDYLRNSKSVGQGGKTDLFREYLAMVNQIRLKVQDISEQDYLVSFDTNLTGDASETFHKVLSEIEIMLHPISKFKVDEQVLNEITQTGIEKEIFGGLICFLPKLLQLMQDLAESIERDDTNKDETVDLDTEHNFVETGEENKENVTGGQEIIENSKTEPVNRTSNASDQQDKQLRPSSAVNYVETWTP
ncbi:uncharacterized protein LOC128210583 [Mya arenaria]|uniref:uncharacterized protein LOC128210583 n=1 Tax=Mya arenaria TaxID=6604 RepID=UPI0022E8715B|nr:uncharacterized protein LOC128210583 [Mya arenaria]